MLNIALAPERESKLRRNIRLAVLLRVSLCASAFSTPIIVKLAEDNGTSQSGWLSIDLPSGHFADRVSRKLALAIGGIFLVSGAIFYGLSTGFASMIFAELLLAIGFAFCSGADHTLIYESYLELGEGEKYDAFVPKLVSLEVCSMAVFALTGGIAGAYYLRLPFIMETIAFSSFLITVFAILEPRHSERKQKSFLLAIKSAKILSQHPKRLDLQLALSAVCFAGLQTMLWYYQAVFNDRGVPLAWNGYIFFGYHVIAAIAAQFSRWTEKIAGGYPRVLYIPLAIVISVYLLVGFTPLWVIPLFAAINLGRGLNNSLLMAELNRNIPSDVRTTFLSLKSLVNRGAYVVLLIVGSLASTKLPTNDALLAIALTMSSASLVLAIMLQRRIK
jgi:MFS family permease